MLKAEPEPLHSRIYVWIGGFASLIAIVSAAFAVRHDLGPPKVSPSPHQLEEPFTLPFEVQNASRVLPLNDVTFRCLLDRVHYQNGVRIAASRGYSLSPARRIGPGQRVQYECALSEVARFGPVVRAEVHLQVNYRRFGQEVQTVSEPLTWTTKTRAWVAGAIVR